MVVKENPDSKKKKEEEKLTHIIQQCQEVYFQQKTSVISLTKLVGLLSSTVQAILPGKFPFRFLQQEQMSRLKMQWSYQVLPNLCYSCEVIQIRISFVDKVYKAIQWRKSSTARTSDNHPHRCFYRRVGSTLQWNLDGGKWSKIEQGHHINVLELMAVTLAILIFTKNL